MKVTTKLALGYGLLLALLVGLLAYHFSAAYANAAAGQQLSVTSHLLLNATDQRYWLDRMEESVAKYQITGDSGYVRRFDRYADRFDEALDHLETLSVTDEERRLLAALSASWSEFLEDSRLPGRMVDRGVPEAFIEVRERTDELLAASREAMEPQVRAARERTERAQAVAWMGGGLALLLSAGVWLLVVRAISDGMRMLTEGTRRVASGDFEQRIEPEGEGEFARLARDFNAMTEQLAEIDEMKERFISRVSHDLKSPLASMQEANNLLLDELLGSLSEEQRSLLELSNENCEQLGQRITKLLEVSRLDAGTETLRFEEHDVAGCTRDVAERMRASFVKRDRELNLELPVKSVRAVCDRERFEQALENLLENARRFAPAQTAVVVTLADLDERPPDVPAGRWEALEPDPGSDGAVRLTVADAGPGVPENERERIFHRFFQGNGTAGRDGGVGLGLALCREVVELHGGAVWVDDAAGGGARFNVLLPRRPAGVGTEPEATGPAVHA